MNRPHARTSASGGAWGDKDADEVFVIEDPLDAGEDDLFDLPITAGSLLGMDPVESAAAVAAFAHAEAEPVTARYPARHDLAGEQSRRSILGSLDVRWPRWRMGVALGVFGLLGFVLIGAILGKRSIPPTQSVESSPAAEPSLAQHASTPGEKDPRLQAARSPEAPSPEAGRLARAAMTPAAQRSGRDRLLAIESALASGRRGFARIELGRLLLDADALPETEREETRAQAELLVARILQDAADEARRSPR